MRTINSSVPGPVTLSNPTADNPLYISSSGTVTSTGTADGIDGAVGTTWTITKSLASSRPPAAMASFSGEVGLSATPDRSQERPQS